MNSLVLLNGSPRGERSNSMKMLKRVAEGWVRGGGAQPEVLHLVRRAQFQRAVEAFAGADVVLLGMPLYTDAMPAMVKAYIEALAPRVEAARVRRTPIPRSPFSCSGDFPRRRTRGHWNAISKSSPCGWVRIMQARLCAAAVNRCSPCRSRPTENCGRGCRRWVNSWRGMAVSARQSSKPLRARSGFRGSRYCLRRSPAGFHSSSSIGTAC